MSLAVGLLAQAEHLRLLDRNRPTQANLRRAVSAAYYALFNLLVTSGANCAGSKLNASGRAMIMRSFEHATMKTVCSNYAKATLTSMSSSKMSPSKLDSLLTFPIANDLKTVADAFVELQEQRHRADYDASAKFDRIEVSALVKSAQEAFLCWATIKSQKNTKVFMIDLLLRKSWLKS